MQLAVFDLDGTIANSMPGIYYSYRSTARDYGFPEPSDDELRAGLSGSLPANLQRMLHLPDDEVKDAVMVYRDYYLEKGESLAVPFEGIADVIDSVRDAGIECAVATMKVEEYALMSLYQWDMVKKFKCVHGADMAGQLHKSDLIGMCLEDCNTAPEDAVMIGDSMGDLKAARQCKVNFIGAAYGFNLSPMDCRRENVPYAETVGQIVDRVLH